MSTAVTVVSTNLFHFASKGHVTLDSNEASVLGLDLEMASMDRLVQVGVEGTSEP